MEGLSGRANTPRWTLRPSHVGEITSSRRSRGRCEINGDPIRVYNVQTPIEKRKGCLLLYVHHHPCSNVTVEERINEFNETGFCGGVDPHTALRF